MNVLCQWPQDKLALKHSGMRNQEVPGKVVESILVLFRSSVHDQPIVGQDVEVDCSRAISDGWNSSNRRLDVLE
jgi:hypothetical protein